MALVGITVCKEWLNSWHSFRQWALSSGWNPRLYLDRINNEQGYSPNNCRWVTPTQSMRNRRCTKLSDTIVHDIISSPLTQSVLAEKYNLNQSTISRVRNGLRWNLEKK